tara:strand:- start:2279 stop:3385 length:1107 start_codon:yes stop_codon:yes gene_type:complete
MNGFEKELREKILSVASHVTIKTDAGYLGDWGAVANIAKRVDGVTELAPFILAQGLIVHGRSSNGVLIRGVDPAMEVFDSGPLNHLTSGAFDSLEKGSWNIVVGEALASRFGVEIGDKLTVIAPEGRVSVAGVIPKLRRFEVSGIFRLGMFEYDSAFVLLHIDDAAKLFQTGGGVTGIRLSVSDIYQAPSIRQQVADRLSSNFIVSDWTWEHQNLFKALQLERRVMFLILLLIVAVAAFNIVSTLIMVVTDKEPDVAILSTLGLGTKSIMSIFIIQGTLIGIVGTTIGMLLGVTTALNIETLVPFLESVFRVEFFPSNVYFISEFPADLRWADVTRVVIVSLLITFIATLYPAWRASKINPADALRYE